ncbi:DUF4270 domain-containing protein [Salinimicrobium oceani]|uniref:DUF4270 domain-containing protein n=1 Tax=Salinimicrobium oceani TaxID=2722702 RepID=A0ABX1D2P3_9FLAO|nr:DUF4270 domain-containing protein [Salinimicrobium oceani]NJW52943.1 DUF4270 domain-containing protein [Salinimicrobium oceani]
MNLKNKMLRITTVVAVVFSFIACEDDFETIGSDVLGGPGFNADLYDDAEINAFTYSPGAVQTNNLQLNLLGVYKDPLFGTQEASILSSVAMTAVNPDFGTQPVLDSVVMAIPYFSKEVTEDEETRFELDSIYGNGPIKLSVIESKFYLNSFDPETDFQKTQKYYSDMEPQVLANLGTVLYENESFLPSANAVTEYVPGIDGETDTLNLGPALRVHLKKDFFQSKILDKGGSADLLNFNSFRDYFRGVYIKADEAGNNGSMMLLNLLNTNAGITLYYKTRVADTQDVDDDGDEEELIEVRRSFKLGFGNSRVNIFDQDTPDFNDDENLFLKGGEGSLAVIDLFAGPDADGDGVSDELEHLRENNWLINEANLIFHVNRNYMTGLAEPERVYLYDINNNVMLADYVLDAQGQENNPASTSNNAHLAPLTRNENGEGLSYKVRITRHVNNVLNNDSTNVRLGLVVSQNINLVSMSAIRPQEGREATAIPVASLITPLGTVLYGPDAEDEEKRLKLNIYYTEPKN